MARSSAAKKTVEADEEKLLRELVDQAGQLRAQKTAIESAYTKTRSRLASLLSKRRKVGDVALGEEYEALMERKTVRVIDPATLKTAVSADVFMSLVSVPLGAAEALLSAEKFAEVVTVGEAADPSLVIRKIKGEGETEG